MPPLYPNAAIRQELVKPIIPIAPNNYTAFNLFSPSIILINNLDGLAKDICSHRVLELHGTISPYWATKESDQVVKQCAYPSISNIYRGARKTNLVMMRPEDDSMNETLDRIVPEDYQYIAIIGYSFGKNGDTFDDNISLKFLTDRFNKEKKPIFIIDPYSDYFYWHFHE